MNDINFLPVEYRRKSFDRKDQRRQALIVGVLFLTIGATYTYQRASSMSLASELERAHQLHRVTLDQFQELHAVESELGKLAADAAALAYLDHPWPQTQVVATVANKIPDSTTLTQLRIVRIPRAAGQRRREGEAPAGQTAFARDETVLRERYDASPYQLVITGVTTDHSQLHQFVIALDKHTLIQRAELSSLDGIDESDGHFTFVVTCFLKPGYGVPERAQRDVIASQFAQ